MMRRRIIPLTTVTALLLAAIPLAARWGVVVTEDGSQLAGDISEAGDEVRVTDKGITQALPRSRVKEIRWQPSVDELYREKAKPLRNDDADGWYRLAEWCREQERYDLVQAAAKKVLEIQPAHENAQLLAKLAEKRLEALAARPDAKPEAGSSGEGLLTPKDIQKIRLHEFKRSGVREQVRVEFGKDFVNRFLNEMSGEPEFRTREQRQDFQRLNAVEKLRRILELSERKHNNRAKYADDIEILDDPYVMAEFKTRVLPLVLKNCATTGCHGGRKAARFRLVNDPLLKPAAVYTSFFVLDGTQTKSGARLIDRDKAEESLILQYGLPVELAGKRHPELATPLRPMFRNREDPAYQRVLAWIRELRLPRPDYGIRMKGVGDAEPGRPDKAAADGAKRGAPAK